MLTKIFLAASPIIALALAACGPARTTNVSEEFLSEMAQSCATAAEVEIKEVSHVPSTALTFVFSTEDTVAECEWNIDGEVTLVHVME